MTQPRADPTLGRSIVGKIEENGRESQRMAETDRETQKNTGKGREKQRKTEKDRERQSGIVAPTLRRFFGV